MKASVTVVLVAVVIGLVVASMSLFTVDQRQQAIVFRLGEVVSIKTEPGLYWKLPLIEDVRFFDTRIHTVDAEEPERFLTSEKKNVLVDSFVKWRISDVEQYYISVGGDERRAQHRLNKTVNDSLRAVPRAGRVGHAPVLPGLRAVARRSGRSDFPATLHDPRSGALAETALRRTNVPRKGLLARSTFGGGRLRRVSVASCGNPAWA